MTSEEFIAEWEDPKTKMLFDRAVEALQPAKFVRNRTLVVKFNQDLMEMRNSEAPFDAVVEWWWQGTQALNPKMETPEAKEALKNLFLHQKTFIDIEKSPSFFTVA
jgi:hypothetical protein